MRRHSTSSPPSRSADEMKSRLVGSPRGLRCAFTLVEMVVVVSIILIIVSMVVPSAAALWAGRKNADAYNTVQGMIMTSRALALKADGKERGFFAYVDADGVQQLVSIEQAQVPYVIDPLEQADLRTAYENIFEVTSDRIMPMPAPLRAVPRYVVDIPDGSPSTFSEVELANNSFDNPFGQVDHTQQHRNFFTLVFSSEGEVLIDRDVLIMDISEDDEESGKMHGDLTELLVGNGDPADLANPNLASIAEYWFISGSGEIENPIHPRGNAIPFLIVDPENDGTALNFRSVDSPLLYDDEVFNEITDNTEKREWLLRNAQPMYINRWTGSIIRGPVGEVQTQ